MVGALKSPNFFLSSLLAVTKPTNKATFGIARPFHEVNLMCEISRVAEEAFCKRTPETNAIRYGWHVII